MNAPQIQLIDEKRKELFSATFVPVDQVLQLIYCKLHLFVAYFKICFYNFEKQVVYSISDEDNCICAMY